MGVVAEWWCGLGSARGVTIQKWEGWETFGIMRVLDRDDMSEAEARLRTHVLP